MLRVANRKGCIWLKQYYSALSHRITKTGWWIGFLQSNSFILHLENQSIKKPQLGPTCSLLRGRGGMRTQALGSFLCTISLSLAFCHVQHGTSLSKGCLMRNYAFLPSLISLANIQWAPFMPEIMLGNGGYLNENDVHPSRSVCVCVCARACLKKHNIVALVIKKKGHIKKISKWEWCQLEHCGPILSCL